MASSTPRPFSDTEGLPEQWREFLDRNGKVPHLGDGPVLAYLNHARWVADCTCNGGMLCRRGSDVCCCLDCGAVYQVAWPDEADDVEQLVGRRPPENRNYDPRRGEDVDTLRRENTLMGVR